MWIDGMDGFYRWWHGVDEMGWIEMYGMGWLGLDI
jgi:hypothetical protein